VLGTWADNPGVLAVGQLPHPPGSDGASAIVRFPRRRAKSEVRPRRLALAVVFGLGTRGFSPAASGDQACMSDQTTSAEIQKLRSRPSVRLPALGRMNLPDKPGLLWYAGIGSMAAMELIEWPVAALVAGLTLSSTTREIATSRSSRTVLHRAPEGAVLPVRPSRLAATGVNVLPAAVAPTHRPRRSGDGTRIAVARTELGRVHSRTSALRRAALELEVPISLLRRRQRGRLVGAFVAVDGRCRCRCQLWRQPRWPLLPVVRIGHVGHGQGGLRLAQGSGD
jgi:hypothetical protein